MIRSRFIVGAIAAVLIGGAAAEAPKRVLWGDLHVHSSFSMDAFVFGERVGPAEALAFAAGGALSTADGRALRLERPLDFAAVTDHAETLGIIGACLGDRAEDGYCRALRKASTGNSATPFNEFFLPALNEGNSICRDAPDACEQARLDLWQRTIQAANNANRPGTFTALVGSEWSPSAGGLHLHRNLIYRSDRVPERPPNANDQRTARDLWRVLEATCLSEDGCEVLAIPHNSNLSLGRSFLVPETTPSDHALRARFERLLEVHQHKGQSECYPGAGLSDEHCGFEVALPAPLAPRAAALTRKDHEQIASGYLRQGLAQGLRQYAAQGMNALKFGLIGSTDSHSGRAGYVTEQGWLGTIGRFDADPARRRSPGLNAYNPGGLAGVWAIANTREAIFAALKRRETFATSGPRIQLRFSQSWDPRRDRCRKPGSQPTDQPMGSVLRAPDSGRASPLPVFHLEALPDRVPLRELQLIRLRLKEDRVEQLVLTHQWAATAETASPRCWRYVDDSFDASLPTVWYARVLQQPTASWRHSDTTPDLIQERAWSSPIWWEPAAALRP